MSEVAAEYGTPPPPRTWRRVRDEALRFDRHGVLLRPSLRMAAGVMVALAIGYAAGSWAAGAAAAGGALSVGIPSLAPSPRPRVAVLTSTAAAMALGTFVGSATSEYAGLHVVAVGFFTFVGGLLVAVEPAVTAVGLNAIVGLVVYGRFPGSPETALKSAGLVAAGGLFQVLLVVVLRGRPRVGRALTGLSRGYAALASYAADLDLARSSLPLAAAIDAAVVDREFAFGAGTSGASEEACRSLVDEARRIMLELLSLASVRAAAQGVDEPDAALLASFDQLASRLGNLFDHVVDGLAHASVPADLGDALTAANAAIEDVRRSAAAAPHAQLIAARATTAGAALAGQLRAVAGLLPAAVEVKRAPASSAVRSATRISRVSAQGAEAIVERMQANLTWQSDAFQHAVRLAVVVSASAVIAHAVGIGRGYWLALTAVLVLRPEFSVTYTRGVARAVGTVVGVGIATIVAVTAHPHGWVLVPFVGVFVWLSGALFNASYAAFSVAVTGAVVFLLAGLDADPVADARDRLVATVLGAGLALGAYALAPTWGRRPVADAVADLADTTQRYVALVLHAVIDPAADTSVLPGASRAVRLARTNAEAAINRSLGDPASRRVDPAATLEMLATFRRLAIAAHTLRLSPTVTLPVVPAVLKELTVAIDSELEAIAARMRFGRVTVVREPLRALHREVAAALPADPAALGALVVAETDEIVDATNSLADIVERAPVQLRST
ncbi:MAG TPA: FUSC family protein [Acidothermaceae bacterium]|nr:FUSC family protein [Acidothermaceae bacterium]